MEVQDQNDNINKRSRIAQANKDIEAMNIIDKVKNFNLILIFRILESFMLVTCLGVLKKKALKNISHNSGILLEL